MVQKKIWMRYLTFGIFSFFILLTSIKCETTIQYRQDADIIYRNETNKSIRYFKYDKSDGFQQFIFELSANSEIKIEERGSSSETTLDNCCHWILFDLQGDNDILIDYNNSEKCLIYSSGEGSTTANYLQSYQRRQISEGYYELIYTFTEEEYNQADNCN